MMTATLFVNPTRGCGTKKADAFYAGAGMGSGGALSAWTWVLGNGVEPVSVRIPPRQPIVIDLVATLLEQELVVASDNYDRNSQEYRELRKRVPQTGLGDHVGASFYDPISFATETQLYGPSRRVSRRNAELIAILLRDLGPLPIMFTHSQIPVFSSDGAAEIFIHEMLNDVRPDRIPTWEYEKWTCYAMVDGRDSGSSHYLRQVLDILHLMGRPSFTLEHREKLSLYLDQVTFIEQPFGVSWITQISYTLPADGKLTDPSILEIPGIDILDLRETESDEEEISESPLGIG